MSQLRVCGVIGQEIAEPAVISDCALVVHATAVKGSLGGRTVTGVPCHCMSRQSPGSEFGATSRCLEFPLASVSRNQSKPSLRLTACRGGFLVAFGRSASDARAPWSLLQVDAFRDLL